MKSSLLKWYFLLLIFGTILINGCSDKIDSQKFNQTYEKYQRASNVSIEQTIHKEDSEIAERSELDHQFSILQREIDVLIKDGYQIGPDHYQQLNERLDSFEKQGIEKEKIDGYRQKLFSLNPDKVELKKQFNGLQKELDTLIADGLIIGSEHYKQLNLRLENFEKFGIGINEIKIARQKLLQLNLEKNKTEIPINGLPGLGNVCSTHEECLNYCPNHIDECQRLCPQSITSEICNYVRDLASGALIPDRDKWIFDALPECTGQEFTIPPVDFDKFYEITPLGNIGPPGHTLPTPHMYFHISPGGSTTKTVPFKAPGEIYVIGVSGSKDLNQGEFSITFALCKDVFGYFNHVKSLSDEMRSILKDTECDEVTYNPSGGCSRRLVQKMNAGTILGEVGGLQGNFDFGAYDYRVRLSYVNPASYGDLNAKGLGRAKLLSVICPLELYNNETKIRLYSKIARVVEPKCGEVMQDSPEALQGSWFYNNGRADLDWENHLSFVYDNNDPSKAVVAIAGILMDPAKWVFTPKSSGLYNRKFSDVTSDGNIYCYDEGQSGKIILQMINNTMLNIEYQSGSCTTNLGFVIPKIYKR